MSESNSETKSHAKEVWALVCHRDDHLGGVISPACGKREVRKFCGDFAANGYTVTPVYSREEYEAMLATFKRHF